MASELEIRSGDLVERGHMVLGCDFLQNSIGLIRPERLSLIGIVLAVKGVTESVQLSGPKIF